MSGNAAHWIAAHRDRLRQRMDEVEACAAQGTLPDAVIENGRLTISPLRRSTPDEAEEPKARLYGLLPRVRITTCLPKFRPRPASPTASFMPAPAWRRATSPR